MAHRKQRQEHRAIGGQLRLYQHGSGEMSVSPLPGTLKRRLPRPPASPHALPPLTRISPAVQTIAAYARETAAAQSLTVYSIFNDWSAMLEATLERWAINSRSLLLTGQVTPDPPEVAAVFNRVRDRRDAAAQRNPAVARLLEQAWLNTFALLTEAAQLDLWRFYAGQPTVHPDVIGQAFLAAIDGDAAWAGHFPAWPAAIELAQSLLPDGYELAAQRLAVAARAARQDGLSRVSDTAPSQAAEFEIWYSALEPYLPPLVIGPPLTDNSALTLAAAAQFPPFLVKRGKVLFQFPPNRQPLLCRLQRINAMLYHLNGYLLDHLAAMTAVETELHRQSAVAPPGDETAEPPPEAIWRRGEEPAYEPAV